MITRKTRTALLLSLALLLCGCGAKKANTPVSDGFAGAGEFQMGVGGEISDLNAKALRATTTPGNAETGEHAETVLTFSFVSGSIVSGSEAETAGGTPGYSVYTYDNPARLVIEMDNLAYWDYRRDMDISSPLIRELFQYTLFGGNRVYLCFQLTAPVRFLVETEGDTLRVRLREQAVAPETLRYYVTANAYADYRAGSISAEFNAAPTLAADLHNILLISPAFETEEDANAYLASSRAQYPHIAQEQWQVVSLHDGELPAYNSQLDYIKAYQTSVVRLDGGAEVALPVLIPDGLYLCDIPNGGGMLYSHELPADEGAAAYQQLYAMRLDGQVSAVTAFEFSSIERAQYSPDGRRLAVLERSSSATHLYVFDAYTFELLNNLSEMGFGSNTSTFIWNSLGNTIYAITGTSAVQLHQFDYSIPDETKRHSKVDSSDVDEGSLGYSNSELYFAFATLEGGSTIYHIKPEGGVRKPFLSGGMFAISNDARYMAVAREAEGSTDSKNEFFVYEFETGAKQVVTNEFYPYDFLWAKDGTKLYYIENRVSGGQTEGDTTDGVDDLPDADTPAADETPDASADTSDPYPYTLWVYDTASGVRERLFDLNAADMYVGPNNNTIYVIRMESGAAGTLLRSTYLLNIDDTRVAPATTAPPAEGAAPAVPYNEGEGGPLTME